MDIRLMDTPDQVEAFATVMRRAFDVVEESASYANRGGSAKVRKYLDLRLRDDAPNASGIAPESVTAIKALLTEVETTLDDDHADRTYALESVKRQLTALLDVLDGAGVEQ
ncbi:hypothetical protein ABIA35_000562 [Catenulispora sp. MAP12-49]|uniref:hypothetical protein n=1 Tax=Catenulispora sp. MAP12-49 TaxID=3156302 RepID=UPI003513922A